MREPPHVSRVHAQWSSQDHLGAWRCRWGRFRERYRILPGLYALAQPDAASPVLVTTSYKLTFDVLRRDLGERPCWLLVLETGGLNAACAAAGGLLNTAEVVTRIQKTRLAEVVEHRTLILPAHARPAVSAELVQKHAGFEVRFGPVRSADLPAYLAAGMQATPEMETVRFPFRDRLALVPMELVQSLKKSAWFVFAALIYAGLGPGGVSVDRILNNVWPLLVLGLGSVCAGSVFVPLLLPLLPLRTFSLRGWLVGGAVTAALLHGARLAASMDPFLVVASYLFFPAASAFLAMGFTGSTPLPSESGMRREIRLAFPAYIVLAVLSLAAFTLSKLRLWGLL